jgi:hypothetical protein
MNGVNLAGKLAGFANHFKPRTVAQFNGHDVMVVKVQGPFGADRFLGAHSGLGERRSRPRSRHVLESRGQPEQRAFAACGTEEGQPDRETAVQARGHGDVRVSRDRRRR